ncbi:MAG: SBBP repeat-containing protein [candidate division WOR-3 bacterium]|nr:SBBP repeat-containing protein [candidate division WOR-3 bacterium]
MTRTVLTIACLLLLGASAALGDDDTMWTRRYDGQGRRDDYAKTVLVDQEDNVIVVGTCMGTSSGNDVGVVKYDSAGTEMWFATIAGPGASDEEAKGAAVGPDGAIYITASTGLYPDFDMLTVKYTAEGTEAWRRTWGGADSMQDVPVAIAVDTLGNSYVTGYTIAAGDSSGWVTMKRSTGNGLLLWTAIRIGGLPAAIVLGPGNAPYITGYSAPEYLEDYATVKYSTDGVEQWASFYNYSDNGPDKAVAITVDAAGNAYVTGTSASAPPPGGLNQYATVKYANDSGAEMWVARYEGQDGNSAPAAIALGTSAVYVTGSSQGPAGDDDYATVAYDKSSGSQLWATRYNGPAGKNDDAVDIAVPPSGDILVTGTSINSGDKGDFLTILYTATGEQDWVLRSNSPFDNDDVAAAVTFDGHSKPIVTGSSFGGGYYDFLTVKYGWNDPGILESTLSAAARPGMRLSPNPARNWTNLQHSFSGAASAIVSLLGVDGRVVRTQRFDGQAAEPARLDLTGLAPGVYVVRLDAAGRHATSRLVVQQ